MKYSNKLSRKLRFSTVVVMGLLASTSAHSAGKSASQCKGLENAACSANAACGWVDGYQRKDGRKVNSFCRTTARAKSSAAAKTSAAAKAKAKTQSKSSGN